MRSNLQVLKVGVSAIALAAGSTLGAVSASAQADATLETVVVTGTSIKGVVSVGSNLVTVSPAELTQNSGNTLTEQLSDIPTLTGLGVADRPITTSNNGNVGVAIYIHGVGSNGTNSTLVLLDGHRIPASGTLNYLVDPNNIPAPMIERVEILPDGASAVYGSDAVAGVVNFITRKRFDGIQVSTQASFADGTNGLVGSILAGKSWSDGGIIAALSYSHQGDLPNTALPSTNPLVQPAAAAAAGLTGTGTTNFGNFSCSPATIRANGAGNVYLNAQSATNVANTGANSICQQWSEAALFSKDTRLNTMVKINEDINDRLSFNMDLVYDHRTSWQPQSRGVLTANAFGPGSPNAAQVNPFYTNPPGVTATSQQINYDFNQIYGPGAYSTAADDYVNGTLNVDYQVTDDWDINLMAEDGYDASRLGVNVGVVNQGLALLALNGTTNTGGSTTQTSIPGYNSITLNLPLTTSNALDVWDPVGSNKTSAATLSSLLNSQNSLLDIYAIMQVRLSAQGTLFQLPAGPVKVAVGIEQYNNSLLEDAAKPENNAGANVASQSLYLNLKRLDEAEYVEAVVPVISPAMNIPLIQNFTLDFAARHDDYSGLGPTTNPKGSFVWDVIDGLSIRGSMSTSFVAPPLTLVGGAPGGLTAFASVGASTQNINIPVSLYPTVTQFGLAGCTATSTTCNIGTLTGITKSDGLYNAIPQSGRTWSIGADYSPSFLPGLSASATLWNVSFLNGDAPPVSVLVNNSTISNRLTLYPSCATQPQLTAFSGVIPITSVFPACTQFTFENLTGNLVTWYVQGVDAALHYKYDTDLGTFSVDDNLSEVTKFNEGYAFQAVPSQLFNVLNSDGFNSNLPTIGTQNRINAGWTKWGLMAGLAANWTGAYRNVLSPVNPVITANGIFAGGGDHVKSNVTLDLVAGYGFDDGFLGNDQLTVVVKNLTDKAPPYFNSTVGYDGLVASVVGRTVSVNLTSKF